MRHSVFVSPQCEGLLTPNWLVLAAKYFSSAKRLRISVTDFAFGAQVNISHASIVYNHAHCR